MSDFKLNWKMFTDFNKTSRY